MKGNFDLQKKLFQTNIKVFYIINDLVASNNAEILGTVVIVVVVVGIFLHRHAKSCKIFKVNFHNVWKKYTNNFLLIIKI